MWSQWARHMPCRMRRVAIGALEQHFPIKIALLVALLIKSDGPTIRQPLIAAHRRLRKTRDAFFPVPMSLSSAAEFSGASARRIDSGGRSLRTMPSDNAFGRESRPKALDLSCACSHCSLEAQRSLDSYLTPWSDTFAHGTGATRL